LVGLPLQRQATLDLSPPGITTAFYAAGVTGLIMSPPQSYLYPLATDLQRLAIQIITRRQLVDRLSSLRDLIRFSFPYRQIVLKHP
jgi:hypothetical protein